MLRVSLSLHSVNDDERWARATSLGTLHQQTLGGPGLTTREDGRGRDVGSASVSRK
jgi:hypothetical protein